MIDKRIAIQGVYLDPQPAYKDGLVWGERNVSSEDSGRTEDGNMHNNVVNKKKTLNLKFNVMTEDQASVILNLVDPNDFPVTYFDLKEKAVVTKTFYVSDRTAGFYSFSTETLSGIVTGMSFNLIEV